MTKVNLKFSPRQKNLAPITKIRTASLVIFMIVLGLLLQTQTADARPMKKRDGRIVKTSTLNKSRSGKNLVCISTAPAPVYSGSSGRWTLRGQVVSDFTLKELTLKTSARTDLGSTSERIARDQRVTDERLFNLKPDPFCNYELALPRDFSGEKRFNARLVETCDNMFDGTTELNCSIR